jgi:hypothetical protein
MAIALPALEFFQGTARAQAATGAKRFLTFFEHGGTLTNHTSGVYGYPGFTDGTSDAQGLDAWRPTSTPGQPLMLGAIHKPLADAGLTNQCVVLRGLDNVAGKQQGDYGNGHGISNVTVLTCGKGKNAGEADDKSIAYGPSIDQVLAARWGAPAGGLASINLLVDAHNYGSPFFKASKQYASRLSDPRAAFSSILANVQTGGGGPDPAVVRAQALRVSVLDGTAKNLERYKTRLSAQDKLTVQAHLEAVRSIEQRVAAISAPVTPSCSKPTVTGTFSDVGNTWQVMADIALAALRCGQTRVLGFEVGDFHMTWDPTPLPFEVGYDIGHSLHHMARDMGLTGPLYVPHPTWLTPYQDCMIRNRQLRAKMVATLLKGLQDTPEGSGTMLDNTLLLWTSEFSNGANHLGTDMPVMLAGKAGGALQGGRYLNFNTKAAADDRTSQYTSTTSMNNLMTSVLNLCGFNDTGFGDAQYASRTGGLVGL